MSSHPAIFLDRDGVIIENRSDYVRSWEDVELFPQALTALAGIRDTAYKIIIVTNQSGVGRGHILLTAAHDINERLVKEIEQAGGRVDAVFMCPHAPDAGCDCRKPKPGLLLQAAAELSLDLGRSIMIGDALTDLAAGRAAGVGQLILLRTGRGATQGQLPSAAHFQPYHTYDTLQDALSSLIDEPSP